MTRIYLRFNDFRDALAGWLDGNSAPDWLREATANLPRWRSPDRLYRVCRRWARERFAGDEAFWSSVQAWLAKDRDLHEWADHQMRGAIDARNAYTTQTCSACWNVEPVDAAAQVDRTPPCSACGSAMDQDWNAARNLLASGQATGAGADPLAEGSAANGNGKSRKRVSRRERMARARDDRSRRARQRREGTGE